MQNGLSFGVLGPLEVLDGDSDTTPTAPRQRAILAVLLINAGKVVSTDRLIDALWGESPPATARSALSVHVAQLRRGLGPGAEVLQTRRPGYIVEIDPDALDSVRFEDLVATARSAAADSDQERAVELFAAAERLWRGFAYVDFEYTDFARAEARRLNELRHAATTQRIDAQLEMGQHLEVVGELEALTEESPGAQRVWAQLMLALYRCGRQQDALAAYRRAADGLAELGLEPLVGLRRLEEQILLEDPELSVMQPAAPPTPTNLPPPRATFVGRDLELDKIQRLLAEYRLVTITGPGGVGKTRLALEAAAQRADDFPGGVWLVDLGTTNAADEIEAAWADALGIATISSRGLGRGVATRLPDEPSLVIVDNVEHVTAAAAAAIGDVLDNCLSARVIATGRSNLALSGEAVLPLMPMAVPEDGVEDLLRNDSVRLFADRVSAHDPDFTVAGDNARLIGRICQRLDGLPLAIELAAAHIPALGVRVILDRLEAGHGLPDTDRRDTPPRHRTLWSTMAWSYDLLEPAGQALFRRIGIFAGSPDLEAIAAVCGFGVVEADEVLALLGGLVRNSMILRTGSQIDGSGFAMLDTIREFAAGKLEDAGEAAETAERHRRHYLDLAINGPQRIGETHRAWYTLFSQNRLDFGSAIRASFDTDAESATRGYQSLAMFFNDTGRTPEARALTNSALKCLDVLGDEHRGTLLQAAGQVAFFTSDWKLASQRLTEALEMQRRVGDAHQISAALNALGVALIRSPRFEEARAHFVEALQIAEGLEEPMIESAPLTNLGISYLLSGPTDAAAAYLQDALHRQRSNDDEMSASISVSWLAIDSWLRGDASHAIELYDESIEAHRRFDARGFLARNLSLRSDVILELSGPEEAGPGLRESLDLYEATGRRLHYAELVENCGFYAAAIDEYEAAAELLGAADELRQRQGILEPVWSRTRRNDVETAIRLALTDDGFDAAHRRGSLRSTRNVSALIRHIVS